METKMGQEICSLAYCFTGTDVQVAYYHPQMDEPERMADIKTMEDTTITGELGFFRDQKQWECFAELVKKSREQLEILLPAPMEVCASFTFSRVDGTLVKELQSVLQPLFSQNTKLYIQDFQESMYDFIMFQKRELRSNEVVYLKAEEGTLQGWMFREESSTHGHGYGINKEEFPDFRFDKRDEEMDRRLAILMERFLGKRLITSVFLEGEEFSGGWLNQTIKVLCRGRRVFGVQNIVVKGACYRPFRRTEGRGERREYYLGQQQIRKNVGLYLLGEHGPEYSRMITAGTNWYEAKKQMVLLLDDCDRLEFLVDDVKDEKKNQKHVVSLETFPKRPNLATKIRVTLQFENETDCQVTVTDLGLGELYPASYMTITDKI